MLDIFKYIIYSFIFILDIVCFIWLIVDKNTNFSFNIYIIWLIVDENYISFANLIHMIELQCKN